MTKGAWYIYSPATLPSYAPPSGEIKTHSASVASDTEAKFPSDNSTITQSGSSSISSHGVPYSTITRDGGATCVTVGAGSCTITRTSATSPSGFVKYGVSPSAGIIKGAWYM